MVHSQAYTFKMSVVDGLPFKDDKKKYILDTLDPVLEEMVSDLLTEMPGSPQDFMITWLRKRSGVTYATVQSLSEKNRKLKQELLQCNSSLAETGTAIEAGAKEEEEDEEDEDDEMDEIPESLQRPADQMGRARQSVSAESYGAWNQKKAFDPPNHPKTDDQKIRLKTTLMKSFMFSELEANDMEIILKAMKETILEGGTKVIEEGEDGDYLFVVEKGSLDCIKKIDGEDKVVKTCNEGDIFGELALLYNCPRAASVIARGDSVCWQLDRETVNHVVKDAAIKRRTKYEDFLKSVALIATIGGYERSQIADALKPEIFKKGDVIVRQDEPGDKFYIVEDGALYATKEDKRVMEYKAGDYFGELALLKNQPRAASVIVDSESAKVLAMSRVTFSAMIGPLQSLLAKQEAAYT